MELASEPYAARRRASVSDAKLAYFEGDFERCLEICASIRVSMLTTASEVALITARAYLRSGRPREAQITIAETRATHTTLDAWLTAHMLEATALVRQGDADTGISMLLRAATNSAGAHFAIRSEIALCTALGYWAKRQIDVAERYLVLVDPRSDIIYARALELQAWCHTVRQDYRRAADFFRLTLLRLDDCQASDRAVAAVALSTLAVFAAELFDPGLADFVDLRMQNSSWTSGVVSHQYVTVEHQALFHEFAGNTLKAFTLASRAQEIASTVTEQACGWALRSAIALDAGEVYSAIVFGQHAQDSLATIDPSNLNGEARFALLTVAECCAQLYPDRASSLLLQYSSLRPIDVMLSSSRDPRPAAYEAFVTGVVCQARGEDDRARSAYREAFDTFSRLDYVRRAIMSAHALLKLTESDELRSYIATRMHGTANYITRSLSEAPSALVASIDSHPVVATLTRSQREVVFLICTGKTNKEIAELRSVTEQTIKNAISKNIFPAFGVSSRAALLGQFLRERSSAAG